MFIVKINRESIHKNPRAGDTSTVKMIGNPVITVRFTTPIDFSFKELARSSTIDYEHPINTTYMAVEIEATSINVDIVCKKLIDLRSNIVDIRKIISAFGVENYIITEIQFHKTCPFNIETYYPHEIIHHLPLPEYLYEYEDCEVECESCRAKFSYQKLEYDTIDDELGFGSSDDVCPECGHWDCCEWEYEDINKVISEVIK